MEEKKPYYPSEWENDQSMTVLFAPFRENRDVNPQSWDRKMKFWSDMICKECDFKKSGLIDVKSLAHCFRRNGKNPVCLGIVLQDLQKQEKIQSLSDFKAGINTGWLSWGFGTFIKKPLSWTFGKLLGTSNKEIIDGDYVLLDVVKRQAEAVLDRHHKNVKNEVTDHLVEYSQLQEQCKDLCADDDALQLVLLQLIKDGQAVITQTDEHERIVRFAKLNKRSVTPVSELELKVMRLHKAEEHLQSQVLQVSEEMERCRADAKFYLGKGLKNSAKNALRRKKTLERVLEKREAAVETIHSLIQKIKDTESDKLILDAYAAGSSALKEIFNLHNLSTDNIDDVMCDVQETLDMHQEINASISQGVQDPALDVSTAELEAELDELLSGDTSQQEGETHDLIGEMKALQVADELDFSLPSVPTFDPATPPQPSQSLPSSSATRVALLDSGRSPPRIQAHSQSTYRFSPPQQTAQPPIPAMGSSWGGLNRNLGQYDNTGASISRSGLYSADRNSPGIVGSSDFDTSFPSPPRTSPREERNLYLGPSPPQGFRDPLPNLARGDQQGQSRKFQRPMMYQ